MQPENFATMEFAESEEVIAFTNSMPETYAATYEPEERAEHARIVGRRASATVHIERWRTLADGGALICVVADDRPGLLSFICNALLRRRLEVRVAQIYSRKRPDDTIEAVDFFWLRPMPQAGIVRAIEDRDLEKVAASLADLLEAPPEPAPLSHSQGAGSGAFDTTPHPRAFFNTKALRRGEHVLVVEVPDFPGLLLSITTALHEQGVEIASSDIRTEGALARDCFMIRDATGEGLSPDRLATIRQAVVTAVRAGYQKSRQARVESAPQANGNANDNETHGS
jgi:UTP:GlnB (protein PII) uridylyltransferase